MQFDDIHDSPYGTSPVHNPFVSGIGDHFIQNYEPEGRDDYHMWYETDMTTDITEASGHTHGHLGATTCQDGHVHMHPGVTSKPIETSQGHVHKISGDTTFDDKHTHYYESYTSVPIALPDGSHTHYVEIQTTEDDGHIHLIKGFTQPSKS